jgi:hypothetical protein
MSCRSSGLSAWLQKQQVASRAFQGNRGGKGSVKVAVGVAQKPRRVRGSIGQEQRKPLQLVLKQQTWGRGAVQAEQGLDVMGGGGGVEG